MNQQESIWSGEFGDEYNQRNVGLGAANLAFFAWALKNMDQVPHNIIEFGCGTGQNLYALSKLFHNSKIYGIDINFKACKEANLYADEVYCQSVYDPLPNLGDLVISKGVAIHQSPEKIKDFYHQLYNYSRKYILMAEYFSAIPEAIPYRGEKDLLWKRHFCKEMLELYPSLLVVDTGFASKEHELWPQDDLTWCLLEKM